MMETIYHAAINASCDISKERYELLSQVKDMNLYDNIPYYYDKNYFVNGEN